MKQDEALKEVESWPEDMDMCKEYFKTNICNLLEKTIIKKEIIK